MFANPAAFDPFNTSTAIIDGAAVACCLFEGDAEGDNITDSGVTERATATIPIAQFPIPISQFPAKGALIEVDRAPRLALEVTPNKEMGVVSVSLSAPFTPVDVARYTGKRPSALRTPNSALRTVLAPARCLFLETPDYITPADSVAPSYNHIFLAAIPAADWLDETPPAVGDTLETDKGAFRVFAIAAHSPAFLLHLKRIGGAA